MIPELIGVLIKAAKKRKLTSIPLEALVGFNDIISEEKIELINPVSNDVEIIYNLINNDLNDLFNAALYATSMRTGICTVTFDSTLIKFSKNKGYHINNILLIKIQFSKLIIIPVAIKLWKDVKLA